jgi:hypothetical protein
MKCYIVAIVCVLLLLVTTAGAQEGKIITTADNGKTIMLNVNETFLFKLDGDFDWDVRIDNRTVMSPVLNVPVVEGAQGIYVARRSGNATLTAIGRPLCGGRPQVPCARPYSLFKLNVVVAGHTQTAPAFEVLVTICAIAAAMASWR